MSDVIASGSASIAGAVQGSFEVKLPGGPGGPPPVTPPPAKPPGAGAQTPTSPSPSGANGRSPRKGSPTPDPVGELRFKVKLPGIPGGEIGRFREVSGIGVEIEMKDYNEGGNNDFVHKLPTRLKYPNLVLKRGVTHEANLLNWFLETRRKAVQVEMSLSLMGPAGEEVRTWSFVNAYPVKWTGPTLNAASNQIAMETLEIVHQGMRV